MKKLLVAGLGIALAGCASKDIEPSKALAALKEVPKSRCSPVRAEAGIDLAEDNAKLRAALGSCIRRVDGYKRAEQIIRSDHKPDHGA